MSDPHTTTASPWQRIRQRKLVQWALAYLAGAWLVLQLAELLAGIYGWSPQLLRLVPGVLAIGLPVALVLGWYHGERGAQRISRVELALLTLVLLAGGALLWSMERGRVATAPAPVSTAAVAASAPAQAIPARSIAVLPFVNMSADPANEYFSDGLSETLLDMLAQVPDLMVAARTSSFAFKGKQQDIRHIGAALGVAHMLEGSVQKSGDQVRITAQLIKADDGSHLWSRRFDRKLDDVFRIQDEIAIEVVAALKIALGEKAQLQLTQRRTENVEAYEEYLKGIELLPRRKVAELRRAVAHFERAITLDPTFAKAYVGAGDAYMLLVEYGTVSEEESGRIERYNARALELAPELGEAHASRGSILRDARDFAGAEREYRRAIELAPSYAPAHHWYGLLLMEELGRFEESLAQYRTATTLDPLAPVYQLNLASALDASGRLEEARVVLERLTREHPEYPQGHWYQSLIAGAAGDLLGSLQKSRDHEARDPDAIQYSLVRCVTMVDYGALPEARSCVDSYARRAPTHPDVVGLQIELAMLMDGPEAARLRLDKAPAAVDEFRAGHLLRLGRGAEALAMYRELAPELLADPPPALPPTHIALAIEFGAALLGAGEEAKGRALIRAAMERLVTPRKSTFVPANRGFEALGPALLGDREGAHAALVRLAERPEFIGLPWLDHDPLYAPVRADPRYEQAVAPARARAAEQVRLAREAGLL